MNIKTRLILTIAILFCLAVSLPTALGQEKSDSKKKIRVSSDPNQVVIRLDVRFPEAVQPPTGNPLARGNEDEKNKKNADDNSKVPPANTDSDGNKKSDASSDKKGLIKSQSDGQLVPLPADPPVKVGGQEKKQASTKTTDSSKKDNPPPLTANKKDDTQQAVVQPVIIPRRTLVSTQPNEPLIEVYADGRINCGRISANANRATSRLSKDQLQNLLSFIVDEHKFYELNSAALDEKIKKDQRIDQRKFANFTFTVITEDENGKKKERQITEAGIRSIPRYFPDVEYLQHLKAIDQRLNQLYITINVGGRDKMVAILARVNEELKKNDADAPPFTVDDATFVAVRPDGNLRMTFGKSEYDEKGNEKYRFVATFSRYKGRSNVYVFGANR